MSKISLKLFFLSCLAGISLWGTSCSSDEEILLDGEGASGHISLNVSTDAGFAASTKAAVDEADYQNLSNYTVQVLNATGEVATDVDGNLCEYSYNEMPGSIELKNGPYSVKAFYGEEHVASRSEFLVEGTSDVFNVQGVDLTDPIKVICTPTCGKVKVVFDAEMSNYFVDYYVSYSTETMEANGEVAVWEKDDTDPWYLGLAAGGEEVTAVIYFVGNSANETDSMERTYHLNRNASWTLNIAPEVVSNSLSIQITLNEDANEKDVEVTAPAEWA